MRKIASVLVTRYGLSGLAGAAVVILHLYGGLSVTASILLGVALTMIGAWLYGLGQIATFKPYKLVIGIRYDSLWNDLKLTPAPEGVSFENVTLTAISSAIFARSNDLQYSSRLELYRDVPCGAPAWRISLGELKDVPTFYLRPHRDGYQFGVHVEEEWWKRHSLQLGKELRDRPLNSFDNTVALGILPYGYIPEHVRLWNEPVTLFGGYDRKQRRWEKRLSQEGWTIGEYEPTRLTHRYIGIGYYDI